jgi:hypothetical protein
MPSISIPPVAMRSSSKPPEPLRVVGRAAARGRCGERGPVLSRGGMTTAPTTRKGNSIIARINPQIIS